MAMDSAPAIMAFDIFLVFFIFSLLVADAGLVFSLHPGYFLYIHRIPLLLHTTVFIAVHSIAQLLL